MGVRFETLLNLPKILFDTHRAKHALFRLKRKARFVRIKMIFYEPMRFLTYFMFLVFFIFTGVMIFGNMRQLGEFFFLQPYEGVSLAMPFLGFSVLGAITGMLFLQSIRYVLSGPKRPKKQPITNQAEQV
jgi:hypothetical protein